MPLEADDTLRPSGVSGSGLYGIDTASVEGDDASEALSYDDDNGILGYKASGSLIRNDNSRILRLSVQGFEFSELGPSCWEDVEISRAGHRKVVIQLLDIKNNPQDRKRGHSLVIDLDHVLLEPWYMKIHSEVFRCSLRAQKIAKNYLLRFKAIQDVLKFQEVFTGFSVQIHIPDVNVYLHALSPKHIQAPRIYQTAIQLWRKVPIQHESYDLTTDAPHIQPHAWNAEEGKARSRYEALFTKTDPTTTSNIGLDLSNGSVMETSASSLLVFSGEDMLGELHDGSWWASISLDGRVRSTRRCICAKLNGSCKHITFDKEIDPTSYWREISPQGPLRDSDAIQSSTIGLNVSRLLHLLTVTPSSLPSKSDTITEDLKFVELEFRTIEDKMNFKAAYDTVRLLAELNGFRRQNRTLLGEAKLPSYYQSPREQVSLKRKSESAGIDAGNMDLHDGMFDYAREEAGLAQDSPALLPTSTTSNKTVMFERMLKNMVDLVDSFARKRGHLSRPEYQRRWRASTETSTKREQWRRRISRRIIVFILWKREQEVSIPNELWSSPASFEFIKVLEMSTFDKIKGFFETYSGREWNWWPFSAAAKPLESGKVRITWQCACGDQRWTDASKYLAQKCQALFNESPTAGHERGNATSQSAASVTSHSPTKSVVPGSFPPDASQTPGDTSKVDSTAQASHIQNTYNNSNSKDLYVLFCVYQKSQILHSQIFATKCHNDEAFFENIRQEYRRLRGFFRFWFSPLQFSHCDFVKFTRFYVNELAKVGHSLPDDLLYEYSPRPPGPHDDPPISPHEFRRRFYTLLGNPCGRSEALERIPKRQKRFQINLHVDGREDMWGLLVELQPCFLVVLMWQIVITAGGWAFMGWWLSRHQGDLQNAAMPITLIITALMALWVPIGKGMRDTL